MKAGGGGRRRGKKKKQGQKGEGSSTGAASTIIFPPSSARDSLACLASVDDNRFRIQITLPKEGFGDERATQKKKKKGDPSHDANLLHS